MNFLLDERLSAPTTSLRLPAAPPPAPPSPFPLIAAIVPVVAAGTMWAVTGSTMMLWFAALTPVMLVGSFWDRRRGRRTAARAAEAALTTALDEARLIVAERHESERRSRRAVHPGLVGLCEDPVNVWRAHSHRDGTLTLGTGTVAISPLLDDDGHDPRSAELRAASGRLEDAPIVIPLDGPICVRGPRGAREAVARALLLQLCVVHPAGSIQVAATGEEWIQALPQAGPSRGGRTVALVDGEGATDADIVIRHMPGAAPPPAGTTTIVDIDRGVEAVLRRGAVTCSFRAEPASLPQARALAAALRLRAATEDAEEASVVSFAGLSAARRGTLGVAIGRDGGREVWIDLVDDGPHAVVVGTTGSGKSEMLVTWALALTRTYRPSEVMLVLADFKGGTAFDPISDLPHVAGVITDLDGSLAERAVRSLVAEVRRREMVLAEAGARDVLDERVSLPRLVVMVDEFPALIAQHPQLDAVFTDISARGRALGVHLVLGGQRVAGAVRDATLANCGLRVALRVSEGSDSRVVIGDDSAARLGGAPQHRGTAFVRRAGDAAPGRVRFALSAERDIEAVRARGDAPSTEPPPWLPPLPTVVPQHDLREAEAIALADLPDSASRRTVLLRGGERGLVVLGGPGTGKSAVARIAAAGDPGAVWLSADPETAWTQMLEIEHESPSRVVADDIDLLLSRFPEPWAGEFAAKMDALVTRGSITGTTVVLTAQRPAGPLGRTMGIIPRRALLRLPSVSDHVAFGGLASSYDPRRGPGRAILDGEEVQFGWTPERPRGSEASPRTLGAAIDGTEALGWVTRLSAQRVERMVHHAGLHTTDLADLPAGIDVSALRGTVVVGDPDQWQRGWHIAELVRHAGALIVGTECSAEYRIVTGDRRLPPYAGAGRAWFVRRGEAAEVVTLE